MKYLRSASLRARLVATTAASSWPAWPASPSSTRSAPAPRHCSSSARRARRWPARTPRTSAAGSRNTGASCAR
ncbi:MAG: hypothetical protein MZW92_16145 [Comamonadaceae bacterium]|nr:hypothetical protein [Comamonadaceae bacterium]